MAFPEEAILIEKLYFVWDFEDNTFRFLLTEFFFCYLHLFLESESSIVQS